MKKYPTMARFGTRFGRAWGILPRPGTNHTHKPYIDELKILYSLCIPRHDTVSFVFIDVELTTPEGVHWRKSTRKWLFLGPALQGRGASSPARGQVTHTNLTPMNYKYCLVCACQGMASPLQSKLSPQISCATGLGVPIWYTLFKVSAQLVCSWLP